MPDVLQDGGPRCDTDTSSDQNSDFVFENILSRSTIGSVDFQSRHLLPILKSNLVHAHGIHTLVQFGLSGSSTNSITEGSGEVTDLANVDRNIRVVWARGDGKRMPLVVRDGWQLQEKPLACLVLERRLRELDLDDV